MDGKNEWSLIDVLVVSTMVLGIIFPVVIAANFLTGFEPFYDLYVLYFKKYPELNTKTAVFILSYVIFLTPGAYVICSIIVLVLLYSNLAFTWVNYGIKADELTVRKWIKIKLHSPK